ncbi:Chitotriosidase-1 [Penicillium subrubescens]|uniref:Chitotriosidase-1 n=1 Tax=Penicillium subrubescens TaxID=1316194 RepID=A0A1Q5TL64_9EURO|nr:Chitotriosidase-1 [Penicillium subrubescens]
MRYCAAERYQRSPDEEFYVDFNALKDRKPGLKTFISVGGWDAGGKVFSDMARFPGTRSAFISSSIALIEKYGFDSIDIDWEYPAAEDRDIPHHYPPPSDTYL